MDYMNVKLWHRIIHDFSSYAVMLHVLGPRSIQFDFPDSYFGLDFISLVLIYMTEANTY